MLMGLMDQFVPFVEDGSKTHSMRAGNRWKVGMRVDLYAKSRQKGMRLIFRAVVMAVQKVTITTKGAEGRLCIVIDDVMLSDDEANAFAWRDGFRPMTDISPLASLAAMAEFWRKTHDLRSGAWRGQIVHWDYEERFVKLTDYARGMGREVRKDGEVCMTTEEQPLNFAGKWLVRNGCLTAIVHQQIDGQWRGVIAADIETSWDAHGNNAQYRDWDLVERLDGRASKR